MKKLFWNEMAIVLVLFMAVGGLRADLEDGLVSYYPCDEGEGTIIHDETGNYDGELRGTAAWVDGPPDLGKALDFTGAGYVFLGTRHPGGDTNQLTIALWAKWHGGGNQWQGLMGKRDGWDNTTNLTCWYLESTDPDTTGRLYFQRQDQWSFLGDPPQPVEEWQHICVTFDGTTAIMYINGQQVGQDAFSFGPKTDAGIAFGAVDSTGGNPYNGVLDEVRIYDRALSPEEVIELYEYTGGIRIQNPVPENGAVDILLDQVLSWEPPDPEKITDPTYTLYFGTEPNVILNPSFDLGTQTSWSPDSLQFLTTYYWRVDVNEPNDLGPNPIVHPGKVLSFTMIKSGPIFILQPANQVVSPGESAEFTIEIDPSTAEGTTYQWYKQDEDATIPPTALAGQTSTSLTISNAAAEDQAYYFCRASNGGGTSDSQKATLAVRRQVAYWSLNGDTLDHSGNGHDAVLKVNDPNKPLPTFVDGVVGEGLMFNNTSGEDGQFAYAGNFDPSFGTGQLTVALWASWKGPNGQYQGLIGKRNNWDSPNESYWQIEASLADGAVSFSRNGSWPGGMDPLPVDEWTYICVTFDGTTAVIYRNGVQVASGSFSFGPKPDANIGFGTCNIYADLVGNNLFYGALDEIRLFNYALDPIAVAHLYTDISGTSVCPAPLPYDFNNDCIFNLEDFAIIAEHWMDCNLVPDCK